MARPSRPPSKVETIVSVAVLLALAGVAAALVLRQIDYSSPFLATLDASTSASPPWPGQGDDLADYAGKGLSPMSPQESFTADTLFEKIDGRAELYLSAGVVGMRCRRLAMAAGADAWFEVFVYDMASGPNAFTVYSKQRRETAEKIGELAYRTSNALYFVHGKYYVEIVAASDSEGVARAMSDYRERFISAVAVGDEAAAEEPALFPRQLLRAGSISRSGADDFGIAGFDGVYTAVYDVGGVGVTAFISRRASPAEASELAKAYADYYRPFGAEVEPTSRIANGSVVAVLDTYKIVFSRGATLAGVHESTDRQAAEKVAEMLYDALGEAHK